MADLDTLRTEVAEAIRLFGAVIEELGLHDDYESALHVLCAELLRLAALEHAWQQWIKDGMRVDFLPPEPPK